MNKIKTIRLGYIIDLVNNIKDINIKQTKKNDLINIIYNNGLLITKNIRVKDIRSELFFYKDYIKHLKNKIKLDFITDLVKEEGITKMIINYTNIEYLIVNDFYKDIKEYNDNTFKIKKLNISLDLFKGVYL